MRNIIYCFILLLWGSHANTQTLKHSINSDFAPQKAMASDWNENIMNWEGYSQHIYTYQSNLIKQELVLSFDGLDTGDRYTFTYDNSNRLSSQLFEKYDKNLHKFIPTYRRTISTSGLNPVIEITFGEIYNSFNDTWREDIRVTIHTLADGTINYYNYEVYYNLKWNIMSSFILDIDEVIDSTVRTTTSVMKLYADSAYQFNTKKISEYNLSGELLNVELFYWVTNTWEPKEKYKLEYLNNKPFRRTNYKYNFSSSTYNYVDRIDSMQWNDFNPQLNPLDQLPSYSCKANYTNDWVFTEKNQELWLDNNGSSSKTKFTWQSNQWIPFSKYTTLYDDQKNLSSTSSENYLNGSWEMMYGSKYINSYLQSNLIKVIRQNYDSQSKTYLNEHKIEYSDFIQVSSTPLKNLKTLETKLYPNPSHSGTVHINVNMEQQSDLTLQILDINGKIIHTEQQSLGTGMNTLNLHNISKGLYLVLISTDFGVSRTKMIVE